MSVDLLQEYVALLVEKIRSTKRDKQGKLGAKFDLKRFKELPSSDIMLEYARQFLEPLGMGSSRAAWVLSGKYALKVVLNKKGLAQNQTEVDVYTNPQSKPVVTAVHSADPEYRWIISDLVNPLQSPEEFKGLTGIEWNEFLVMLHDHLKSSQWARADIPNFAKSVIATAKDNGLMLGDLKEIGHWGKTPDGRCVLLDYGFTHEVWSSHYSEKPKLTGKTAKSDEKTNAGGLGISKGSSTHTGVGFSDTQQQKTKR